ncbi:MAG: AraC family transcriptional regulator [Chitinispirillales bacterium]|jgi:AraC-like DNA-binding protein|nr:AraC family transcriptional regulator [Chitinispirillales bacterium]
MKYFIAIAIGIIAAAAVFFTQYGGSMELFDLRETFFEYGVFSNAGTPRETIDSPLHGHIHFSRTAPFDSKEPYQYMLFHANDLFRTIDLEKYKKLEIAVLPEHDKDIMITLYMYVPGFSGPTMESNRPYSFIIRLRPNQFKYQVKLKDFATPNWWFYLHNVREETLPKTDWHKMTHICVNDYPFNSGSNDGEWIAPITEIRFIDDPYHNIWAAIFIGIASMSLFMGIFVKLNFFDKKKMRSSDKKSVPYLSPASDFEKIQSEKLIKFINENYTDPNLTLKTIEKEFGLTKFQVNNIMQRYCSTNYLRYINNLQTKYAKELLRDKENSIQKIAKTVGYPHANSFSRAFKRITGKTPAEFRKSLEK